MVDWKLPVPDPYVPLLVYVKLVAVAMDKFTANAVVVDNTILPLPNAIERVLVLLETKVPVVSVKSFSTRAPLVNVVIPVAARLNAPPNVVVPDTLLIVNAAIVLPLLRILPVPTVFRVSDVNVPPDDNVRSLAMFNVVAGRAKAVVPNVRLSNQLAVVSVMIAMPVPVNDRLGALVAVPPVVPNTHVLVIAAFVVNPPVPVQVKPVAIAMLNTVVAAVVCDSTMLFVPNAIDRVLELLELKIPVVKLKPPRSRVPLVNVVVPVATREGLSPNVSVPPAKLKPMPPNCLLN
jgi:hypothetical protein